MNKIAVNQETVKNIINSIPLSRFGKPNEVANLITYLLSNQAAFITGSEFLIDGGQSI